MLSAHRFDQFQLFWLIIWLCLLPTPLRAQITPDGTTSTTVDANGNNFTINDGERAGGNLFHSFGEFSVPTGSSAFFNNASDVENIINRVTGGNISNIDGLIRANGSANLFLLNPAGIIFGPNARLNIGGSFFGSTADSLLFDDGTEFSATETQTPILTINAPIGLNLRDNPQPITNRSVADGVGLQVSPGESITLVGGNLNFNGGIITAPGGNISLGGLLEAGTVGINDDGSLSFPDGIERADVTLTNAAEVDVRAAGGGSITVNARNLNLTAGASSSSILSAGITADSTSSNAQAGDIIVNVTDNLTLDDSRITNQVAPEGVGNSGNITIVTDSLKATNGGDLDASTFGEGNAGLVEITASDTINIDGENSQRFVSGATSVVAPEAEGNAGGVTITTGNLNLTNGGEVDASTFGNGNAGSVNITANDTINIDGENSQGFASSATSQVNPDAEGNTGGVTITTGNLTLRAGGRVDASTLGIGNAGSVEITARDTITFDGENLSGFASSATSLVNPSAEGNAGGVTITTDSLSLSGGGQVSASTFGLGDAGSVEITASDTINIDGEGSDGIPSGAFSVVATGAEGNAGGVTITTGNLNLRAGGRVDASTFGLGDAGSVEITASDTINIDGEGLDGFPTGAFSLVNPSAEGNAGGVTITTGNLNLRAGGQVDASTFGLGDAGLVEITASDTINIDGEGSEGFPSGVLSSVESEAEGNAGGVTITTGNLNLRAGGRVDASTFGEGNAGNVSLDVDDMITVDDESLISSIVGSEAIEDGSDININTANLLVTNGGLITAETLGESNAGNLTINASESIEVIGLNSGLFSRTRSSGNSGTVNLTTPELTIQNNAQVGVNNFIETELRVEPSGTTTRVINLGGEITVELDPSSGRLVPIISEGEQIEVDVELPASIERVLNPSEVTGDAGTLNITAANIQLSNGGEISALSVGGNGGEIKIRESDRLTFRDNSNITATAAGLENLGGDGGNITIDADFIIAYPRENNDITANAFGGQGGNITIFAEGIFGIEQRPLNPFTNDINASSEFGLEGNVAIDTPEVDATQGTIELPDQVVSPETLTTQACNPDQTAEDILADRESSFTVTGRGGLPSMPTDPLTSDAILREGEFVTQEEKTEITEAEGEDKFVTIVEQTEPVNIDDIVPARGMIVKENGVVILTGYPVDNNGNRSPNHAPNCSDVLPH